MEDMRGDLRGLGPVFCVQPAIGVLIQQATAYSDADDSAFGRGLSSYRVTRKYEDASSGFEYSIRSGTAIKPAGLG